MQPVLIIIHGVPGAGKTTLKNRLAADTGLPSISKDQIKENLYEVLSTKDLPWKEMLGKASIQMLYVVADEVLATGQSLIIENAFFKQYAPKDLTEIAEKRGAKIIEIYCHVPIALAKQRFIERQLNGERHAGHRDDLHAGYIEKSMFWERYQPLKIGEYIEIATTTFDEQAYSAVLERVMQFLQGNNQ